VRLRLEDSAPGPACWDHGLVAEASVEHPVDLVVNVFERTYRHSLEPGLFATIAAENLRRFARRVLLINNVADPADAQARARRLLDAGEIDEFHFVADRLEQALAATGLSRGELEPLLHYSDAPLVAGSTPGSPWLLYWDPEARLIEPHDWIGPALELMERDARVLAANPSWEAPDPDGRRAGVEHEAIDRSGEFVLGHGFSDQVFLARRTMLASPIYRQRCIARIAYPAAHKAHVFEARVAAHMRHHGLLRATSLRAGYATRTSDGGSSYPPSGVAEAVRYARNGLILRLLGVSPWRPRCLRGSWL
jgi:hypothetical protein